MKKLLLTIAILATFSACNREKEDVAPSPQLTEQEKSDLLFLREEEKLARDVYIFAYERHGLNVFSNIAQSEQTHADQALNLLAYYGIADPADGLSVGQFSNQALQKLYDDLTAKAALSLPNALEVGATIEDMDIADLEGMMAHTSRPNILLVYSNLQCGSRNHMRSFVGLIDTMNGEYVPQYISQTDFDAIIATRNEKCGLTY